MPLPQAVGGPRVSRIKTMAKPEIAALLRTPGGPPPGPATLYFTGETAPAPEAAWINGTAAHAPDYDAVAVRGHPSPLRGPAILAAGGTPGSTGRDPLPAHLAGSHPRPPLPGPVQGAPRWHVPQRCLPASRAYPQPVIGGAPQAPHPFG